jgi:hypothetical protein
MRIWLAKSAFRGAFAALALVGAAAHAEDFRWFRGNTHVHGVREGNAENVAPDWYRGHGYDFIVRTEHELIVEADRADDGGDGFLVIPGQEITQIVRDPAHPDGIRHAHVNGLGIETAITPVSENPPARQAIPTFASDDERFAWIRQMTAEAAARMTASQSFERNIAAIRAQGGIAQVNHPNLEWSIRPEHLRSIDGPFLLEIANGFPFANNEGGVSASGEATPSTEDFWDRLLSEGKIVWAVASDDAHDYENFDWPTALTPDRGWIAVRAPELSRASILEALRSGNFYASTGVELGDIRTDSQSVSIMIRRRPERFTRSDPARSPPSARFTTTFIGQGGRILKRDHSETPRYDFQGGETYVRAVIEDSDGRRAWTQPVFRDGRSASLGR